MNLINKNELELIQNSGGYTEVNKLAEWLP